MIACVLIGTDRIHLLVCFMGKSKSELTSDGKHMTQPFDAPNIIEATSLNKIPISFIVVGVSMWIQTLK